MRRSNSEFQTLHISEEGQKLSNRDYFGYVEMDDVESDTWNRHL